jgi:hypothetical protein
MFSARVLSEFNPRLSTFLHMLVNFLNPNTLPLPSELG